MIGGFQDPEGHATLQNYADLSDAQLFEAYRHDSRQPYHRHPSPALFGFLPADAVILGGLPGFLGDSLMTFSGVASNFAGIPLALAFISTLGQLGMVTVFLKKPGLGRLGTGFNLYT